jgi:hypothetical protein
MTGVKRSDIVERIRRDQRIWILVAMLISGLLFLSTLQTIVNGSDSPYTTDVGEIQNALPRWGTIHWTGYPLYTFLGSIFVTLLRWIGVAPATGASLYSAVWGVVFVGVFVALLQALDVPGALAALGALVAATSTSLWMDASLAEVHTMTMALTVATLLFALRFGRRGRRRDLLLLALAFSQGMAHQRAVLFLAPAVAVLIWGQWKAIWRGLLPAVGLSLLAPLTYLYLPWRVSQGATWTFGAPGTWQRVMAMLLDNRAERIVTWPETIAQWWERIGRAFAVTALDLPLGFLLLGLLGVFVLALVKRWRDALALTLAWVPYLLLTAIIWIGRIGDAQLAAHLPVTVLAAAGLALLAAWLGRQARWTKPLAPLALVGVVIALILINRPTVLAVTRDPSAEATIETVERIAPPDEPTTFMALWGNDYWALAYAQAFQGRLAGLDIVDHNADFERVLAQGDRLMTFSRTFYRYPVSWWEGRLGRVYLSSAAPRIIEIGVAPPVETAELPAGPTLNLENGLWIRSAQLAPMEDGDLWLTIYWQAEVPVTEEYSVAVHLVAHNPPRGGDDILAQADRRHPVSGWYPTARWEAGEIVRGDYGIDVPEGSHPVAVRIGMYRVDETGSFVNTSWLSLPVPDAF